MRVFKQLTLTDRIRIEKWLKDGLRVKEIADRLRVDPSTVYRELKRGSYDKLDVSGFIHYRINHSKEFADRRNHINGIENFWNQAKRVLRKYNGIDRKSFPLFLKECEFRFNFGTPSQQLKILRDWCGI